MQPIAATFVAHSRQESSDAHQQSSNFSWIKAQKCSTKIKTSSLAVPSSVSVNSLEIAGKSRSEWGTIRLQALLPHFGYQVDGLLPFSCFSQCFDGSVVNRQVPRRILMDIGYINNTSTTSQHGHEKKPAPKLWPFTQHQNLQTKPKVRPAIHRLLRIQESQSLSMDRSFDHKKTRRYWGCDIGVISESGGEAVKQQSAFVSSMNWTLKRTVFPTRTRRIYLCVCCFNFSKSFRSKLSTA